VSYFRLQKAGKISPRAIHRFLNSTSRLSQNAGQVTPGKCAHRDCANSRGHSKFGVNPWMAQIIEARLVHRNPGRSLMHAT
jgi:hypothetical protein